MKICRKGLHQFEGRRCVECNRAATRAWEKANPERANAIAAKSRKANAASRAAYQDKWYEANCEAEKQKALARYYDRKAKGLVKSSTDAVRKWRAANPEAAHEAGVKENSRRLRLKHDALGSHSAAEWRAIKARQKNLCAACGDETKLEKDHVVPLSMGGSDYAWNLQGLCRTCNARKGASLPIGTQIGLYDRVPEPAKG